MLREKFLDPDGVIMKYNGKGWMISCDWLVKNSIRKSLWLKLLLSMLVLDVFGGSLTQNFKKETFLLHLKILFKIIIQIYSNNQ